MTDLKPDPVGNAIRQLESTLQGDSKHAVKHVRDVVARLRNHPNFNSARVKREVDELTDRSFITVQEIDALARRIEQETLGVY